jgi:hypothetical protein
MYLFVFAGYGTGERGIKTYDLRSVAWVSPVDIDVVCNLPNPVEVLHDCK